MARVAAAPGRLVIVQEDTENCSVGQMIITHLMGQTELWAALKAPPLLVSKGNVMIGYNPIYEYAALPDVPRILDAIWRTVSVNVARGAGLPAPASAFMQAAPAPAAAPVFAAALSVSDTTAPRIWGSPPPPPVVRSVPRTRISPDQLKPPLMCRSPSTSRIPWPLLPEGIVNSRAPGAPSRWITGM